MGKGSGKGLAIGLAAGLVLLLLSRKSSAMSRATDIRLTPHFNISEWLRSTAVPEVAFYQPNDNEIQNARSLAANVLEPLRTLTGPIRISGGARPTSVRNAAGDDFYTALRKAGYRPSKDSDHETFNGVDIQFPGKPRSVYQKAFETLQDNPKVRQVILYLRTQDDGTTVPTHIHVSAVVPGQPSFRPAQKFAFVDLDGQHQLASVS